MVYGIIHTCHLVEVTYGAFTPAKAGTRFSNPWECKAELTWAVVTSQSSLPGWELPLGDPRSHSIYLVTMSFLHCSKTNFIIYPLQCGSAVERRSLAVEISLSCARPVADGWPLTWVNCPLWVNQPGQLSLSSLWGR